MIKTRENSNLYFGIAIVLFILGIILLFFIYLLPLSIIFFIIGFLFIKKYKTWHSGAIGEETVIFILNELRKEGYYNIPDVKLDKFGNIDHVVIGKNGVFVIETKNHKGFIEGKGDDWKQIKVGRKGTVYTGDNFGNPSKQAKRNALKVSNLVLKNSEYIFGKQLNHFWVEPIVIFTNPDSRLNIRDPTVTILKDRKLNNFIKSYPPKIFLRPEEIKKIVHVILRENENKELNDESSNKDLDVK